MSCITDNNDDLRAARGNFQFNSSTAKNSIYLKRPLGV